jgi:hypothetical protein
LTVFVCLPAKKYLGGHLANGAPRRFIGLSASAIAGWAAGLLPATTSLVRRVFPGISMANKGEPPFVPRNGVMAVNALRCFDTFWIVGGQELALAIVRVITGPPKSKFHMAH